MVPACVDCARKIDQGIQPDMRTVEDSSGGRVAYVSSGFAPAYWGGFGYGGAMLGGFLLGEALASPPIFINEYGSATPASTTAGTTSAAGTSAETAARTSAAVISAAEATSAEGTSAAETTTSAAETSSPRQLLSPPAIIPGRPQLTLAPAGQRR